LVELNDVGRKLLHGGLLRIVGTLRRGDEQAEH